LAPATTNTVIHSLATCRLSVSKVLTSLQQNWKAFFCVCMWNYTMLSHTHTHQTPTLVLQQQQVCWLPFLS